MKLETTYRQVCGRGQSRFTGLMYVPVGWKVTSRPARGPCWEMVSVRVSASVARQSTRSCQWESTLSSLVRTFEGHGDKSVELSCWSASCLEWKTSCDSGTVCKATLVLVKRYSHAVCQSCRIRSIRSVRVRAVTTAARVVIATRLSTLTNSDLLLRLSGSRKRAASHGHW